MNQSIRLRAIRFTTLPSVIDQAPKKIRLFLNNRNLGFDDAESLEPAQEIELTKAQGSGVEAVQLRFVKFQTVQTLAIFVENNQGGGDVTRIDKLELIGTNGETSDWSNFNKPEE